MPVSKTSLKTELKARVVAEFAADGITIEGIASDTWDRVCKAIADAVLDHITNNALVSTTVATTGSATAQTGTGTGSIS